MTEPTAARAPLVAVLAWTLFVGLVLYTVLLGGGWAGIYSTDLRTASLAIAVAGLIGWGVLAIRRPEWRPRSAIWPAIVAPLAGLGVATVTSRSPRLGVEYLAWSVALVALYLLLVRVLAQPFARARVGGLAAVLCLGIGLWYVAVVLLSWVEWWGLVGRLAPPPLRPGFAGLTYGNPSAVLTIVFLCLIAASAGLGLNTNGRRVAISVLAIIALIVILLCGSRAGWLAVVVSSIVVGSAWLSVGQHRGRAGTALASRRFRVFLMVGALGLATLLVALAPALVLRAGSSSDGGRLTYFATAIRMFADAPLFGTGPGTWVAQRITYTHPDEIDYYIPHAHNLYLQTAAELGLVGIAVGIFAMCCVGWLVVDAIRGADTQRRRWGWAALFGLVYMGFHSVLDFYANMPAALFVLSVPIAYLDATALGRLPRSHRWAAPAWVLRVGRASLVASCAIAVLVLWRAESIAQQERTAVDRANLGEWSSASAPAIEAAAADPGVPSYLVTRAIIDAELGRWDDAAEGFARAAAADDLPQSWLGAAVAGAEAGAPDAVTLGHLDRAMRLGRQQAAVAYAAGVLFDRLGHSHRADDAFVAALALSPELAADPVWTADPGLARRFGSIVASAKAIAPQDAWEIALMAGDAVGATALTSGAVDPVLAGLVVEAWLGDDQAVVDVQEYALADPLDTLGLAWAARVSARAGDAPAAARFRRLIRFVSVSGSPGGYEIRAGSRGHVSDASAGSLAPFYGHYTYRRPTPWDLISPGIPRLIFVDLAEAP
jgi:O-antigen ligase